MHRRTLLVGLLLVALFAPATTLVAAQESSSSSSSSSGVGAGVTATSNPTDYTLDELSQSGTYHEGAPPSMRFLGQYGSATVRYDPVGVGSKKWKYLTPSTTVKENHVTLKTIRLGNPDETLMVHVVAWQRGTRTVTRGNTTREVAVAANVTHRTTEVELGRGYDNATVPLPASYDKAERITMWIEEYPDARWTFQHRSIPTAASIDIDSWGEFYRVFSYRIGIFALIGTLIGWWVGERHREQALVGPQWSLWKWGLAILVPIGIAASGLYFQIAVLATNIPQLVGLLAAPVVYGLTIDNGRGQLETFLFRQQDITDAKSPRGEDTYQSRYVNHWVKKGVWRRDKGELVIVESGLMPYFARLRGQLSTLDLSELETTKESHRGFALEIELDPTWDRHDVFIHEPPSLSRPTIMAEADLPALGRTSIPNPGFWLPVGILGGLGYLLGWQTLGIPWVFAGAGAVLALPLIYTAHGGGAEIEVAPFHFTKAHASLAKEAEAYTDARTIKDFQELAWSKEADTAVDRKELVENYNETMTEKLNTILLGDLDDALPDPEDASEEVVTGDD